MTTIGFIGLNAMLAIVSHAYGSPSAQRAKATASARSSSEAPIRTTWYSLWS